MCLPCRPLPPDFAAGAGVSNLDLSGNKLVRTPRPPAGPSPTSAHGAHNALMQVQDLPDMGTAGPSMLAEQAEVHSKSSAEALENPYTNTSWVVHELLQQPARARRRVTPSREHTSADD